MNTAKATDNGEKPQPATFDMPPKMNINTMKLKIIMCPATILANKRIINAAGLISNTPANSIGIKISFTKKGTPGGQKICAQKCPFVLNKITIKEMIPNTAVNAVLPVTLAEPGNKPNKLLIKMKKNTVSKYGRYPLAFLPKLGFAISSLTKVITGSIRFCKPFGAVFKP